MKKTQEELRDDFHMFLGYCVAAWAKVDVALFDVFRECVGCGDQEAAIIYYRLSGMEPRFTLVKELIGSAFAIKDADGVVETVNSAAIKAWDKIEKLRSGLLEERRIIAHQEVRMAADFSNMRSGRDPKIVDFPRDFWWEVGPTIGELHRGKLARDKLGKRIVKTLDISRLSVTKQRSTISPSKLRHSCRR